MSASPQSPALSPSSSQHQQQHTLQDEIPLEMLVSHLLASKRSLSSINLVWRANEIVTTARSALEESVILSSRAGFLRKGVSQQTKLLKRVQNGVERVYNDGQTEYQDVLQSLDTADSRLHQTMQVLRTTIVEAAFRPENEEPRSLLSFANDDGVETVRTTVKALLDQCQEAQTDFSTALNNYHKDLESVRTVLASSSSASAPHPSSSPIPAYLHELEVNATEMASLLTSLVQHFDLCVVAIRQTEGGITAVRDAANNDPNLPSLSGVIDSPNASQLQAFKSPGERLEMHQVLSNDAAQLSDVVLDIEERLAAMEEHSEAIGEHLSTLQSNYKKAANAFRLLDGVASKLPLYISSSQQYLHKWLDQKEALFAQETELHAMREFYLGYSDSYDGLILEVERRRNAEEKMKTVLRQALEKVRRMHEQDTTQRADFRREVGDFLPGDLWEGLRYDAVRYDVGLSDSMEAEAEANLKSTPELGKSLVAKARDREGSRRAL